MRKADFDLAAGAIEGVRSGDLRNAQQILERNRHILQAPGVLGMWVGAQASRPYIMVAVQENHGKEISKAIPDSLDGINVYYLEGSLV
jgi:hypothetical protein